MSLREKINEILFERITRKLGNRIESGMSALLHDSQWKNGSFTVTGIGNVKQITVHVNPLNEGNQAKVYAETPDGNTSRKWSIPTNSLEDGIESATGAVYDVTHGEHT